MVELAPTSQNYKVADTLLQIVLKADKNGDLNEVAKQQHFVLNDLISELKSLKTEKEQLDYLQIYFLPLYLKVCKIKKFSSKEFMKFCKKLDVQTHPELMSFYIYGYLVDFAKIAI